MLYAPLCNAKYRKGKRKRRRKREARYTYNYSQCSFKGVNALAGNVCRVPYAVTMRRPTFRLMGSHVELR
jgi:hypothetical protein